MEFMLKYKDRNDHFRSSSKLSFRQVTFSSFAPTETSAGPAPAANEGQKDGDHALDFKKAVLRYQDGSPAYPLPAAVPKAPSFSPPARSPPPAAAAAETSRVRLSSPVEPETSSSTPPADEPGTSRPGGGQEVTGEKAPPPAAGSTAGWDPLDQGRFRYMKAPLAR